MEVPAIRFELVTHSSKAEHLADQVTRYIWITRTLIYWNHCCHNDNTDVIDKLLTHSQMYLTEPFAISQLYNLFIHFVQS